MCSECDFYVCPDGCPNAVADKNDECELCGSLIENGDEYAEDGEGGIVCEHCANQMEIDDVLRICEVASVMELLSDMGRTRHAI